MSVKKGRDLTPEEYRHHWEQRMAPVHQWMENPEEGPSYERLARRYLDDVAALVTGFWTTDKDERVRFQAALVVADLDLSAIVRTARDTRIRVQQALGWVPVPGPSSAGVEDE